MSSYYTRRGDSKRETFGRTFASKGDKLQDRVRNGKRQTRNKRKTSKLNRLNKTTLRRRLQTTQSDASIEDGLGSAEDDGAFGSSENSDNDDDEPREYAPSGVSRKSNFTSPKSNTLSSKIRKAGRFLSKSLSPRDSNKLRSILSHGRRQSTDKVRFNPQVEQRSPSPFVHQDQEDTLRDEVLAQEFDGDFANMSDDNALMDDNDESCYKALEDMISESDIDDADDEKMEDLETQYLINHLIENNELPGQESTFNEVYYMTQSARSDHTDAEEPELVLPSTELSLDGQHQLQDDITSTRPSSIYEDAMDFYSRPPSPGLGGAFARMGPSETGLHTPSSLPQNYCAALNFDAEDTEPEEPKVASVSAARLKRISGHGLPTTAGATGVRKSSKPKTPKRGSFKLKRSSIVIEHNDGELIISKGRNNVASGTITPKGTLTANSKNKKPLDTIKPIPMADTFMQAITAPPSVLTSPITESAFFPDTPLQIQESPLLSSAFPYSPEIPTQTELRFQDIIAVKDD